MKDFISRMKLVRSIKSLTGFEKVLWGSSVFIVTGGFLIAGKFDIMTLIASLVGVTALIFVARGDVLGQVLTVVFSVLYAVISYRFRYFGEMITCLGMTMPIAIMSVITWMKNPYSENEVKVSKLKTGTYIGLLFLAAFVTFLFYFILKACGTSNLIISTISIATSFLASALMMLRNSFYAIAYAMNDVVLIILWLLAAINDIVFLPMIFCFIMFFLNDIYGFFNWIKMEKRQKF